MHKLRNAIVWTLIIVIVFIGVIVGLGALNDSYGQPLIENPGALIGTLFTALGLVATAIFSIVTKTEKSTEIVRENTQIAREQLENSHVEDPQKLSNIRDDLDTKASKEDVHHLQDTLQEFVRSEMSKLGDSLFTAIQSLDKRIEGSSSDIRGIRKDVGSINRKQDEVEKRMDDVESTTGRIVQILESPGKSPKK